MQDYTIGQIAKAAKVPTSTVRYYERRGLIRPKTRARGDYRRYDAAALRRLVFLRAAQQNGFKLRDIGELLSLVDEDDSCGNVQSIISRRLDEVRGQVKTLRRVEAGLAKALAACQRKLTAGPCEDLGRLSQTRSDCDESCGGP